MGAQISRISIFEKSRIMEIQEFKEFHGTFINDSNKILDFQKDFRNFCKIQGRFSEYQNVFRKNFKIQRMLYDFRRYCNYSLH